MSQKHRRDQAGKTCERSSEETVQAVRAAVDIQMLLKQAKWREDGVCMAACGNASELPVGI